MVSTDLNSIYRRNHRAMKELIDSIPHLYPVATLHWCGLAMPLLREERGFDWAMARECWFQGTLPSETVQMFVNSESGWFAARRVAWAKAGELQWFMARDVSLCAPITAISDAPWAKMDHDDTLGYTQLRTVACVARDAALAELVRGLVPDDVYATLTGEWQDLYAFAGPGDLEW